MLFVGKFQQPHTHRKFSSHREAETHDEFPQTSGVFSGMMAQNESSKMPIQTGKSRIPEFCGGDIHVALTGHAICIYIYIIYQPGTQMTLVLIGIGLVLGGLTFKNRGHLGSGSILYVNTNVHRRPPRKVV